MNGNSIGLYDAVPVPVMGPTGAVRFLRSRFPELAHLFSDPDNLDLETPEPYHSYGIFAREVLVRRDDRNLLPEVYRFIDDMALSGQSILQELLVIEVLKTLAQDAQFATSSYRHIHQEAGEALRDVERQIYGR